MLEGVEGALARDDLRGVDGAEPAALVVLVEVDVAVDLPEEPVPEVDEAERLADSDFLCAAE